MSRSVGVHASTTATNTDHNDMLPPFKSRNVDMSFKADEVYVLTFEGVTPGLSRFKYMITALRNI
jgi:hypothetical protein